MKAFYIAALLITAGSICQCKSQGPKPDAEAETNSKYVLAFDKTVPVNDSSDIGIDWNVEKPVAEFSLEGKNKLTYRFELLNDTIAALSQKVSGDWQEQDKFMFEPWRWIIEDTRVVSQFEIKDFDSDGDEDLVCWVMSNINGNEWTYIYINDGRKLVKLYDPADETYYWFAPKFDKKKKVIKTYYGGSAYGHDDESTYTLNGTVVTPLTWYHQERGSTAITNTWHVYKNGKWKLVKTETENTETE